MPLNSINLHLWHGLFHWLCVCVFGSLHACWSYFCASWCLSFTVCIFCLFARLIVPFVTINSAPIRSINGFNSNFGIVFFHFIFFFLSFRCQLFAFAYSAIFATCKSKWNCVRFWSWVEALLNLQENHSNVCFFCFKNKKKLKKYSRIKEIRCY